MFEAVDASLFAEDAHLFRDGLVPPGDGDVKGVIAGSFRGPLAPLVVSFEQTLLRTWNREVDNHRGPASKSCAGTTVKIFGSYGAHEGQLHMRVRIDSARHHVASASVDDLCARRRIDRLADRVDQTVFTIDIGSKGALRINNRPALDQH